jgi:Cholesterol-capturing domain.
MASTPLNNSLHTLEDAEAQNYIEDTLGDQEQLIPNEIPPPVIAHPYANVPRQADYDQPPVNPYYIQQSYDDRMNSNIYEEDHKHCFSMSPVRRMFCLLALFDCLMTFLMWVIYLQVNNEYTYGTLPSIVLMNEAFKVSNEI